MKKKIAIYGGAFSPPHVGHASVIEAVLRLFPCNETWLMPSADRRDKKVSASGEHRLEMLRLIISELFPNPQIPILISDMELKRGKSTTTFETKAELESEFPDYEFRFVLGSDLLDSIEEKWINGRELFDKMNFLAIKNPNISLPDRLPSHLILLEDVVWVNISSTFVRKIVSYGFSGMPYLSKNVSGYIKKEQLYLTQ